MQGKLLEAMGHGRRVVILPVDHGLALGEVEGLEDPVGVALKFARETAIDGTLCSAPVAVRLRERGLSQEAFVVLTLDSALQGTDGKIRQVAVCSARRAKEVGCDGIKVLMSWEEGLEARATVLRLVADAVASGREEGLPVVVEPVAAGSTQRIEVAEIERRELEAARIAVEVGADVIKMRIWDTARFGKFVANCPVPVVALGGGLSGGSSGVLDVVKRGMDIGLSGVFVGRNVWQRPEEEAIALMNEICSVVHSDGAGASGRP